MDKKPSVSVIVPVYKVEKYLTSCVDSLLNQTLQDIQVILVDDGSPDSCGQICDDYAAKDSRVLVIHKANGGLSSARNAGIDAAEGEYLAFCDSDDTMLPDALESMLAAARKWDVPFVCGGRLDEDEATGQRTPGLCPEKDEVISGEEMARRILTWDHVDTAAWDKLYRADLFEGIRYPDGKIMEDFPTTYRLALKGGRAALLAKPVYCYLHRSGSITNSSVSGKTFHFTENVHKAYDDISRNCPSLLPEAHFLKVHSLAYTLQEFAAADRELLDTYSDRLSAYRQELLQELPYVIGCSRFNIRVKLEDTLLAVGLYRPLRNLTRKLRRDI